MSDHLERVTAFVEAWESHDADHNCRSGYIMPPKPTMGLVPGGVSLDRDDLRALVADAQQLRTLRPEYGIRADFTDTTSAEGAVAETLGEALEALDRFDEQYRGKVVGRELIQRPVGDWHEIGDGRG